MIIMNEAAIEAARKLAEVRAQISNLKREETALRDTVNDLFEQNGDTEAVTASGAKVAHIELQVRKTVNRSKLEAMYPEVFDSVTEEKEVRVLKVDL